MDNESSKDLSSEKSEAYTRYWQSRTSAERVAETWRLSVETYGFPEGSLRDGPFRIIRRNADGEEEIVREWSGPNSLRSFEYEG